MKYQSLFVVFFVSFYSIFSQSNQSIYQTFDSLSAHGNYPASKEWFEKNIEQNIARDSAHLLNYIKGISLYIALEQVSKADSLMKIAGERLKVFGDSKFLQGQFASEKANLFLKQRKMPEALLLFNQADQLLKDIPYNYLMLQTNRSIFHIRSGQIAEASLTLQKALSIIEKNNFQGHIYYPKVMYLLGNLNIMKGNTQEAESYFLKAINILEKNFTANTLDYALTNYNLATVYITTGRYSNARKSASLAISIIEHILGNNNQYYAYCLSVIGRSYYLENKLDEAEPKLLTAVENFEKNVGKTHPDYGSMLGSLGNLYKQKKEYELSKKYFIKVEALFNQNGGSNTPNYFINQGNLAITEMMLNNYEASDSLFEILFSQGEALLGKNSSAYSTFQYVYAGSQTEQGKYQKAFSIYKLANDNQKKYIRNYFHYLGEDERYELYKTLNGHFESFNMLAMKYPTYEVLKELLSIRIFSKSILLDETKKIKKNIELSDNRLIKDNFQELMTLKKQLAKYVNLSPIQLQAAKINISEMEAKANDLEKYIVSDPKFKLNLFDESYSVNSIFENFGESKTAIEIIRFREYHNDDFTDKVLYNYLIVKREKDSLVYKLITNENGKSLELAQYEKYYLNITNKSIDPAELALLGNSYWNLMDSEIKSGNHVFISPDGIYNKINFETLSDNTGKLLFEKYKFTIVNNLKEIDDFPSTLDGEKPTALLLGNPAYDLQNLKQYELPVEWAVSNNRSFELKPNAFTEKEVLNVHKLLLKANWNSKVYVQKEAKEEVLKSLNYSPTVLHIASHGYYLAPGRTVKNLSFTNNKNPLFHSLLFLSGAQNSISGNKLEEEDGIFTAYDMANMDLSATKLVVLSACQTGLGKIVNGEGVYGLKRAAQIAGAQNLIISLWDVDDRATQVLLTEFYNNWLGGNDIHTSFKNAQLKVKSKYGAPYFWGGFVLIGN
jgi:CHAT domain-containing protein